MDMDQGGRSTPDHDVDDAPQASITAYICPISARGMLIDPVTPPGRPRSESFNQPPLPPPGFNPPADSPVSPVESVSPPSTSNVSMSSSTMSISRQLDEESNEAISLAIAAAVARRPSLRSAHQRVSNESINSPRSRGSSVSMASNSSLSDGKEHLVEARESLLHRSESIERSRTGSAGSSAALGIGGFEFNVINPTPPSRPSDLEDESPDPSEPGPSRHRSSSNPPLPPDFDPESEQSPEQAWDSVWPANVRPVVSTDAPRPYFPIAPISPFVTPDFSPAVIATHNTARRSQSPKDPPDPSSPHANQIGSPAGFLATRSNNGRSPTFGAFPDNFDFGRRRSIPALSGLGNLLAHSPPSAPSVPIHHRRTQSGSSPRAQPSALSGGFTFPSSSAPAFPATRGYSETIEEEDYPDSAPSRLALLGASRSPAGPASAISPSFNSRPRGKSMSSIRPSLPIEYDESYTARPSVRRPSPGQSAASLPPISLPPPVAPNVISTDGEEGVIAKQDALAGINSAPPAQAAFNATARPTVLRRALSDYDQSKGRPGHPLLVRSHSTTPELDQSPQSHHSRSNHSSPSHSAHADVTEFKHSPLIQVTELAAPHPLDATTRLSPLPPPADIESDTLPPLEDRAEQTDTPALAPRSVMPDQMGEVSLVDEGDVLPTSEIPMDVTFDDEGLNTLERIFLLSNSDFPFHRAYVARVLGDLLSEVDPCESVEYVLPLLSGFSMDEDESVKEAFASELHRILWYFFSTCVLVDQNGETAVQEVAGVEVRPAQETVTVSSEGIEVVPRPTAAELENARVSESPEQMSTSSNSGSANLSTPGSHIETLRKKLSDGPSTGGSNLTAVDTPSSVDTLYSPSVYVNTFADDSSDSGSGEKLKKDLGPLVPLPTLPVHFFTPLIGSLLLSQNATIAESVRDGLVHIISRLRGKEAAAADTWGLCANQEQGYERKSFVSQTGPQCHDLRPFDAASRAMVETEILEGIVIGMGHLSTEMPEGLFADSMDPEANQAELFQEQLIAEAAAGSATSMNLIGSLCSLYSPEEVVSRGFVDEVLRSSDGDVFVRAEGAVALSCLAKVAPVDSVYQMIPLFEQFVADEDEHVRQSVCLSLPAICRRIEDLEYRREFAVNAVKALAVRADDVRCAMLEMLGEVIWIFNDDPSGPPAELLEVYTEDITTYELIDTDWDVVAAFNLPGVALTLGPERWPELRALYLRLQHRAGAKIQRILAASLHELAKILHPDQVEEDLLPVYRKCLTASDEIRERVYEHVDIILKRVDPTVGWYIFGDLASAWRDGTLGGWRAREQVALHLASVLETFRGDEQGIIVLNTVRDALLDPFAAVRDAVCQKIPAAYVVLGNESPVAARYRSMLLDLGRSDKYRQRLTFARCLREFIKPPPNRRAFEDFFLPALPRLMNDVVDIRLSLAQTIADLFVIGAYYGDKAAPIPQVIFQLALTLLKDESADVRDTLRHLDLGRLHRGEELQYVVQPSEPPSRAVLPGERDASTDPTDPLDSSSPAPGTEEVIASKMEGVSLDASSTSPIDHDIQADPNDQGDPTIQSNPNAARPSAEPNVFAASFRDHSPPTSAE